MENKDQYQAGLLENRLAKKYKLLKKWARKERITCYRLYDRDIPEVPVAVDLYEFLPDSISDKIECALYMRQTLAEISANNISVINELKERTYVHLYLYERPYEKDEKEEENWLSLMAKTCSKVLQIPEDHVLTKHRKKQRGDNQYEKIESKMTVQGTVQECGQLFTVNLSDYIDTGLFMDHRPLRNIVRATAGGKAVLNLFCYTGSFSVYAAEGKANYVESVDMSKTYTTWARKNMELNGFDDRNKYVFTRQDAIGFLNQKNAEVKSESKVNRYDLIILDPPTFSNSKSTENVLDINRDWSDLCKKCVNILNPNGTLYFSTNSKRLSFNEEELKSKLDSDISISVTDITEQTIPEDYKGKKLHRCWKIVRA